MKNKVVKAAAVYTVSNYLIRGISIITTPIFTRILTSSDYGITSNFFAWVGIISCISGMGLGVSVVKGKVDYSNDFESFLSSIQSLGTISAGLVVTLLIFNLKFFERIMNLDRKLIILMGVYLVFFQSVSFIQAKYRFEYKYKSNMGISVLNIVMSISFSFFFIYKFNNSKYIGRILGLALPMLILGVYYYLKILLAGKCFYKKKYWKKALKLSLPMIPHSLSMIALAQIDRLMITRYIGNSKNGIYSFGVTYGLLMSLLTNSINEAIQPEIFYNLKSQNFASIKKITSGVSLFVTFISLALIGVAPEALKILGPPSFYEARWIVLPIVLGCYCQFQYQTFACVEVYTDNTKLMAIGSIMSALLNFVLNMIFIPKYGFVAAGYTTFIGYLGLMIFHYWGSKISFEKRVFDIKKISMYFCLLFVIGILLQSMYELFVIRYLILIVISLYVWKENNEIIKKLMKNVFS